MRRKAQAFAMIVALLYVAAVSHAEGPTTQPNAQDVLTKALAAYANRPPVAFQSETIIDMPDKTDRPGEVTRQRFVAAFRQQGEKVDLVQMRSDVVSNEEKEVFEIRAFWNGSRFVHAQQTPVSGPVTLLVDFSREPRYRNILLAYDMSCSYLDGILYDMRHWATLLKESGEVTLQDAMSSIDGSACYVLEGRTKDAHYTVWVDPQCGYLMRKAIVRRGQEQPLPSGKQPDIVRASGTLIVPSVTLRQIDGKWFPVAGVCVRLTEYKSAQDGKTIREFVIYTTQRSGVQWNPDFEKLCAFQISLPNGTAIKDNDHNQMFQWQADKIPPQMDKEVARMIAQAGKAASTQQVRAGSGN